MVKTLLINCFQDYNRINELYDALSKFTVCKVIHYTNIRSDFKVGQDISAVVISGSDTRIIKPEEKAKYQNVSKFIEPCDVPLLGICFGHQLLCSTFGAKTGTLHQPVVDRFERVRVIQTGDILARFKMGQTIPLAECHSDYVLKEGLETVGFNILADSSSCEVEAVKHKNKQFFGVQFHPERITIKDQTYPEGYKIIDNFYCNIVKRLGI
ncbi:MAG: C26 family cysteine hydrolase domain-containing family, partial [Crenarchaeota archaeon]|nr:C26 family cysteine hydrolase domain-containing family [Thermoproteota archaeon]